MKNGIKRITVKRKNAFTVDEQSGSLFMAGLLGTNWLTLLFLKALHGAA